MGAPWRHERLPESQATEAFMPSWTKEKKGRRWNVKGEEDNSQENGKRKYLLRKCLSHHAKSFLCKNIYIYVYRYQFSLVQLLSCVWLFATPWTAARQVFLSITNSQSLPKLMSIDSAMPYNHLILCCSLIYIYMFTIALFLVGSHLNYFRELRDR